MPIIFFYLLQHYHDKTIFPISWITCFIEDRQQIALYIEFWFIPIHASSGVPLGSHLATI
jgi:hypothetical protein